MKDKVNKNSISKTNKLKEKQKKQVKPRINYKKKYQEALEKVHNLEINLLEQKRQNEININAFHQKAKHFQAKAQEEINKYKKNLNEEFQKEKENIEKYGSQEMLESAVKILLEIETAIKVGEKDVNVAKYVSGFKMLINQFYENLENYGVTKISPEVNDTFDSKLHYAIESHKGKKNKIMQVEKEGFMLYDRVIKTAIVILGK